MIASLLKKISNIIFVLFIAKLTQIKHTIFFFVSTEDFGNEKLKDLIKNLFFHI